jgi:hypothetical protein
MMTGMRTIRRSVEWQDLLGRAFVWIVGPAYIALLLLLGYRLRGLRAVRRAVLEEFDRHRGPWLVCANHLTMIDSLILIYAMFSLPDHLRRFRQIPWNLPERNNFQSNPLLAVLCYLAKCIAITRGGDRDEMKRTLDKCAYLMETERNLLIFPEGGRSRTGRVNTETFSYGIGRFIKDFPGCRVMCLYLRGDGQTSYSTVPKLGERFTIAMEVFDPERTAAEGLRAQREYAAQIIRRLVRMEEQHFALYRQRYRGSAGTRQSGEKPGCALP